MKESLSTYEVDLEEQWRAARESGAEYYVQVVPLHMNIYDDFYKAVPDHVRQDINLAVLRTVDPSIPVFVSEVWDRWRWLPFYPSYEKRIQKARTEAASVIGSLIAQPE